MKNKLKAQNKADARWLGDTIGPTSADPLHTALDALFAAGPEMDSATAAARLVRTSLANDQAAVWYDQVEIEPIGNVMLAVTDRGLAALDFGVTKDKFISEVRRGLKSIPQHNPNKLSAIVKQVREYLLGKRTEFDLALDMRLMTDFQRTVLQATQTVPHGSVATYGEIAKRIGKPKAARAVGQALGRNPIPLVIPCHRVLASDGSLGGYSGGGGLATKRQLLQLEGALK